MDKKLKKLRKLRALSEDIRANNEERKLAKLAYLKYKQKYNLQEEQLEEELYFSIKATNEYEKTLIFHILDSFGIKDFYHYKRHSKLKISFKCSNSLYNLIDDELKFYKEKLENILVGTTLRFCYSFFYKESDIDNKENSNKNSECLDKEIVDAFKKAAWIDDKNYNNKIKLEMR